MNRMNSYRNNNNWKGHSQSAPHHRGKSCEQEKYYYWLFLYHRYPSRWNKESQWKNKKSRRKTKINHRSTYNTRSYFTSLQYNLLKEKQQNLQKDEEILQNFSFLKFADATGKTLYLPKIYKNMIIDNFAMFPKETIERRLKYIITGNTHTSFDTWKIAHAYANADDDVIKFTLDNHSKLTKEWAEKYDTHPNVTINNPEAFPPEDVEIDYKINTNTIYHELSHRIFSHGDNEYWINKYLSKITETGTNDSDFAYNYGKSSITEDMATISELMFSQTGWKTIKDKTQKSEIFQAKIKAMKELFHEVSNEKMNEEYFQKIQSGEIKNGRDAQDFFKKFNEEK